MEMSKSGLLLNIFAAALLSACSENIDFQGYSPEQYRASYPVKNKVETRHMLIELLFKGKATALSAKDVYDLKAVLSNVNPHAVDYLTLKFAGDMQYKKQRVTNVRKLLAKLGYNQPINIVMKEGMPENKLVIDVVHAAVIPPACPDWRKSPITTFSNTTHTNYGCSATVNLGLMIDNPRDLVRGRDSNVTSTERSDKVLSDYRIGSDSSGGTATASTGSTGGK